MDRFFRGLLVVLAVLVLAALVLSPVAVFVYHQLGSDDVESALKRLQPGSTPMAPFDPAEPTLVVVDMQARYLESIPDAETAKIVHAVERLVADAARRGRPIVLLEYYSGSTHDDIMRHVQGKAFCIGGKLRNDGSAEALAACKAYGFNQDRFVVCGVYTSYCVFSTVQGLRKKAPDCSVLLVGEACRDPDGTSNLSSLTDVDGVKIVSLSEVTRDHAKEMSQKASPASKVSASAHSGLDATATR